MLVMAMQESPLLNLERANRKYIDRNGVIQTESQLTTIANINEFDDRAHLREIALQRFGAFIVRHYFTLTIHIASTENNSVGLPYTHRTLYVERKFTTSQFRAI